MLDDRMFYVTDDWEAYGFLLAGFQSKDPVYQVEAGWSLNDLIMAVFTASHDEAKTLTILKGEANECSLSVTSVGPVASYIDNPEGEPAIRRDWCGEADNLTPNRWLGPKVRFFVVGNEHGTFERVFVQTIGLTTRRRVK